ncbi:hydantoinase/oxoprolinase family protein (plasmid) [Roseomonas sp. OT10]|uniref:hydantoinase/oxoprolinase family protein n=1 Tax=Roseomonas cutis TaxID=2897332 RepID=UPI001E43FF06|nr:hydantoinase/oxoprolinase family protein [Roseomonas sp. OT10]UFN51548.1 hydantoinase/oxoprolinase family protein [Roseomonas sp. OT10]
MSPPDGTVPTPGHDVAAQPYRLGIDIGGTFTDLSLIDERTKAVVSHKVQSTPREPSRAVARGVAEIMRSVGATPAAIGSFVHGTTIALNAVLERRGAPVAMVVTDGTRDMLELARLRKPDIFNLLARLPPPLVPRRRMLEVAGRVAASGEELEPLDEAQLESVAGTLDDGVESLAVCFLNAHANDGQERRAAEVLQQARPDLHVSLSSALWPEIREYERATVAALNAYVQPVMSRYVDSLRRDMADVGVQTRLYITRSNGGVMSAETARMEPVHTMLSGPASGVVGAAYVAGLSGVSEAVTLDIGGTSADVAVIRDGRPVQSTEAVVGDFPMIMPSVDVFAVGAGGGSIAWFDEAGLLKLGPRSAGAMPGPACYGQGGEEPTTTDAYLSCGYLDPARFAGGNLPLHPDKARAAVGGVAARLGVSVEAAAESMLTLATATMANAIMPMLTKRGIDPRNFTLIAFGGAGPTHACLLAEDMAIPRILVPPAPGALCAYGAAIANFSAETVRSCRAPLARMAADTIRDIVTQLETQGRAWLAAERPDIARIELRRTASMRYQGQAFDVEVEIPSDVATGDLDAATLSRLFHAAYEALYHNSDLRAAVLLVDLRVSVIGRTEPPGARPLPQAAEGEAPVPRGRRPIFFTGRYHDAAIHDRAGLKAGQVIHGPAVIEQFDTTTFVTPGFSACSDINGNLMLTREAP